MDMAELRNRLRVQIEKAYYAYARYEVEATFALVYHEHSLAVDKLGSFVRISDHLIQLDDNHYFIIFAFTDEASAYKASQNLVHMLDHYFENRTSCIALDAFDTHKTPQAVIRRLKLILDQTRKSSYDRVENEHILDGYH